MALERSTEIGYCHVCSNFYNATKRRPRSLFCGHTLCSRCIVKNLNERTITCPTCCKRQQASDYQRFPINYELESVLQQLKMSQDIDEDARSCSSNSSSSSCSSSSCSSPSTVAEGGLRKVSERLRSFQQEFSCDIDAADHGYQSVSLILQQHQSHLTMMRKAHLNDMQQHFQLAGLHSEMVDTIDREFLKVMATIDEGDKTRENLKSAGYLLTNTNTSHEFFPALEKAYSRYNDLDSWMMKARQLREESNIMLSKMQIPKMNSATVNVDDKEGSPASAVTATAALSEAVLPVNQNEDHARDQAAGGVMPSESNINNATPSSRRVNGQKPWDFEEFLKSINTNPAHLPKPPNPNGERILDLSEMDEQMLSANRMFAFQENLYRLGIRYARLSLTSGRLLLHVLGNPKELPDGALLVSHKEVMKKLDITSRLVFLELAIKERILGRILIRLSAGSIFSDHFTCLCTGELGPSYLDARVLSVHNDEAKASQYVCFGDHPKSSGSKMGVSYRNGTADFFKNVNWGREWGKAPLVKTIQAGMVFGYGTDHQCRHFSIDIKSGMKASLGGCFGMVEEGMTYVEEAISCEDDIKDVHVTDCGIVIPW